MTGLQIIIIVALALGVIAVVAGTFISEDKMTTKKEKQRLEEKKEEAKQQFDTYLQEQMEEIKKKIEEFEVETFSTLSKNASHDIEVTVNEAVAKIEDKTESVKKQIDELFDNAKEEIDNLDSQYLLKLEERNKEAEVKADDILEKAMKDLELVKQEARDSVSDLEKDCFERADKAARDAIDELDIISVFKELYEKSELHRRESEEKEKQNFQSEINGEAAPSESLKNEKEADSEKIDEIISSEKEAEENVKSDSDEATEEKLENTSNSGSEEEESTSCVVDEEIKEIQDLAKQIENLDFEVSDEEIEKIKEKENLTKDEKTDTILNLTETNDLEKTKVIQKIEDEFVYVDEETEENPAEEIKSEEPVSESEDEFIEKLESEEEPEEESKLFKVMRDNDIFSSDIDEAIVSEVLRMNKRKKTSMQIAGELGIGIAEVRTIIDLFSE